MIVGQPKRIEDFQPLNPVEFAYLRQPLDQAISQGVPLNQPAAVDLGILCRLLATVVTLSAEMKRMRASVEEGEAQQPEPMLASMTGELLSKESEDTVEEVANLPMPELSFDPARRVNLTE